VNTLAMARADEVIDLVALLLDHADTATGTREEIEAVAERVAVACLGDNHLWQDLRFASRAELSALMARWFPALVAKNHADMKWKKFLYKQLCEREELFICKAPSCAVCVDRPICFGPEEG
jgi:nitrogen fixation protein NifQ